MQSDRLMDRMKAIRMAIGVGSVAGLLLVFLFQGIDIAGHLGFFDAGVHRFLFNRTIRFLLNDGLTIALIYAVFAERRFVLFALIVQVIGMILFLFPYYILKLYYPSYNGPLISFLHRLILNPTLLLLLIPAFYYQRSQKG